MAEMEPIENQVKRDRIAASKRPELKLTTGQNLNQIGKHAYAYSGDFASDAGNDTEYLNFTTGPEYIVATCQFLYGQSGQGDNYGYRIKFNGTTITTYTSTGGEEESEPDFSIPLIIPPFTNVIMSCQNLSSATGRRQSVIFVGEVFHA